MKPKLLTSLAMVCMVGCGGSLPAVRPPAIDAEAAGEAAMKQYDKNGDGVVKGDELDKAPSLRAALGRLDENGDRGVSAQEVTNLIENKWVAGGSGSIGVKILVTMNGRALGDANITFEPEDFLGDNVPVANGTTDQNGFGSLTVAPDDRVHENAKWPAPGLYLVRISKEANGKETIPAKYNEETTLGIEVARRASYMPGHAEFDLKSR